MKNYVLCEPFAGSAALTYYLLGSKPPISYLGGKTGYAPVIAAILGIKRPTSIVLGEVGPWAGVHATLGGASGNAEEIARYLLTAGWSWGYQAERFNTSQAIPNPNGERNALTPEGVASRCSHAPQIAEIIRGWKDEEPRKLWDRLKAEGWPSLLPVPGGRWLGPCDVGEVASWIYVAGTSYVSGNPSKGYNPTEAEGRPACGTFGCILPWMQRVAPTISAPPFPPLAVWQGTAETLALPESLEGWVIYADVPYKGDGSRKITGYPHGDCSRDTVIRMVKDWHERGAIVAISECVSLQKELGSSWYDVDISHAKRGSKRTFSLQQDEWLTLNREPLERPHLGQMGLWG